MKRKNAQHDFLKVLQSSRPTADAAFVEQLKKNLSAHAEDILPEPRVSGLALIVQSMKRYSLAYVGVLVLAAFGTMLLLPKGLDAEEFLAKASESYSESENIFYEKTLNQRFENETVQESSLEEIYYDESGNYLRLIRNPDTQEIVQVDMTVWDENNESRNFHSPESEEGPVTIEEGSEADKWYETYMNGSKYYCVKMGETASQTFKVFLKFSASDPNVYTVDGVAEDKIQESSEDPRSVLSEHDLPVETVKSYLNELKNTEDYTAEVKTVNGVSYYIFEKDLADEEQRHIAYYFNAETYKLDKQVLTFGIDPDRRDVTTYLDSESIPNSETETIFDPSKYDVVEGHWLVAGAPDYVTEEGCYFGGKKLSDEEAQKALGTVPVEATNQWNEMFETMMSPDMEENSVYETNTPSEEELEVPSDAKLPEGMTFIRPTEGNITAGFSAGHFGYDIADPSKPDIVAVADGTVIEVGIPGGWNGGYGNYLVIDHGNGVQTLMANCEEVYVSVGDTVSQGDVVAKMGNTGRVYGSTGIHTHFELRIDGVKVSPALLEVW